jgi:hypothetical protein
MTLYELNLKATVAAAAGSRSPAKTTTKIR